MTPPDANEKLTRRILGGLGVRPVGHQDPNDGDPGQVATAPTVPAQHGNRLPPWWEAKKPVADIDPQAPTAATGDPAAPIPPKPPVPPKPTERPRDWLDNLLDDNATEPEPDPAPDEESAEDEPGAKPEAPAKKATPTPKASRKKKQEKAKKPKPGAPRTAWDSRPPSPRQSLVEAWDRVPYRLKWLAYHASAAYLGWSAGLVDYATYVTAWIVATGLTGVQAFFWYGAATSTFLLYRRSRTWGWPVAWCAAVPAASTVVGVLLYAPTP